LDSETSADMFLYVIMEPFMSQSSVIPWKAEYGPKLKWDGPFS
jgi:hypothetical protein